MLHTDGENQVASIDRASYSSHSPRKVKADTSPLIGAEQKVSQDLTPESQLTGRSAGADRRREPSSRGGSEATVHGRHGERRIRRGANGLNTDLSALLSGQWGGPRQRSRQQQ